MNNKELNEMIEWCRTKLANKHKTGLSGKRLEGYETAIKAFMSYLHSKKKEQ